MHKFVLPMAGLALAGSISQAAAETLSPVIVTATRTAQTADQSLASVTVVTRQDIEASGAQNVIDLLRLQAGVDVARNGGPGNTTSVFLRGTSNKQTLVLIDGVRAASATTGAFAWSKLSLSDVERIEIVRGPNASLYGSDAIGGVIQIFTRRLRQAQVHAQIGSYESRLLEAGFGGGEAVKYSLNLSSRTAEGFSAIQDPDNYSYNSDNDGYRRNSVSGDLRFTLGDKTKLTLQGWYSDGYTEYDQGTNNSTNSTLDARLTHTTSTRWHQTLRLGWAADDVDTESNYPSFIRTRRVTTDWQHDVTLGETALLSLGLNLIRERAKNIDTGNDSTVFNNSRDVNAAYGLLQATVGRHDLQFSTRVDDYDTFGSHFTGNAAWGLNATDALRLTASAGTGFRAPTINELYHPGFSFGYAGNPDLKPETSLNMELGLRYRFSPEQRLTLNAYRNDIDNLIAYQGTNWQAINVNKARIDGLELTYSMQKPRWALQATATLQKAIDRDTGQDLLRRAREKFSLTYQHRTTNGGQYGIEWLFVGKRQDYGNVPLDPYHLVNLSARTPLDTRLWLEGRVENLLATDYELVSGYGTPGLSAYLGVKYDFGS